MIRRDAAGYQFHEDDTSHRCFSCCQESSNVAVVRHMASMMLVHLCPVCLADHMSDYLLDNTRPWGGSKGQTS